MTVYTATSWGRTRRPKNITGKDTQHITGSTLLLLNSLDAGDLHEMNGVYKTENQRFLHLHCSGSTSGINDVYTYMYASACWSTLQHVDPTDGTRSGVSASADQHIVVEIAGIDLIAFNTGSSAPPTSNVGNFAALSTF